MIPGICVVVADPIQRPLRMLPPQSAPAAGCNTICDELPTAIAGATAEGFLFAATATACALGAGLSGVASLLSCGNLGRIKSRKRGAFGPWNRKSIGRTLDTTSLAATAVAAMRTDATMALIFATASVFPALRARAIARAEIMPPPMG